MSEPSSERAIVVNEWWTRALAAVSEGHCPECSARLRTLTPAEQANAARWIAAEPFAICTGCSAVVFRHRDAGGERIVVMDGWAHDCINRADPFRLGGGP